eukprot:3431342-Pleurochrysis_carterae.AAC.1
MSAENTVITQCALHHFQYTSQTSSGMYNQPAAAPQPQPAAYLNAGSPSDSNSTQSATDKI